VSINYDNQVKSAGTAFDNQMWEIIDDTGQVLFIPNIMNITDPTLVDILAWQFHVDFYDPTRDLEFRKGLVQMSISWHRRKGTVSLVQEVVDTFWPGIAFIEEWFQYKFPFPPNYPHINADEFLVTFVPQDVNTAQDKFLIHNNATNGQAIFFQKGDPANTLPAPIVEGTTYYLVNVSASQGQIAATVGGAPINITTSGTGTNEIWAKADDTGTWHDRYRFRVIINEGVDPDTVTQVEELINRYKPVSRWLEGVVRSRASLMVAYVAGIMQQFIYRVSHAPPIRGED